MAITDEEIGDARATGNVVDRVQRNRNKLVQLAQEGDDDDRAFAVAKLKELNDQYGGLSRPGEDPGRQTDQHDDNPSGPMFGSIDRRRDTSDPTWVDRLDNSFVTTIGNPAKRRQMIAEFDKGLTGGVVTRVGRAISEPFGARDMSPEAMAGYARESPLSRGEKTVARGAGMLTPGSLSRTAGAAAERGLMNLPMIARAAGAAPKLVGAAVGAAGAGTAGAAQEGTEALTGGEGLAAAGKAAQRGGLDPLTLALGAAGGAISGGATAAREGNRNVRTIEDRGGRVGTATPGEGGALDNPRVQAGIEQGRVTERGKGRVARQSADAVADTLEARGQQVGADLRGGIQQAEASGAMSQQVPAEDLYQQAMDIVQNPMLTRDVRGRIKAEILDDVLTPLRQAQSSVGGNRPLMMTAGEKNQLKQKLQTLADYVPAGKPGTAEPNAARLAHTARQDVGEELGQLNRTAATEAGNLEHAKEGFGIPGGAYEPIPASARDKLAGRLGRRGADTRTAGQAENPAIDAALNRYPELRELVEAPELLQARGNLEFGSAGKVGGLFEKVKASGGVLAYLQRNYEPAVVRLIAPLLQSAGTTTRAAAPAARSFFDNLGEGSRRRMDQR